MEKSFLEFTKTAPIPIEDMEGFILNMDKQWNPLVYAAIREYAREETDNSYPGYATILKSDVDRICRKGFGFDKKKRTRVVNFLTDRSLLEESTLNPDYWALETNLEVPFAKLDPNVAQRLYGNEKYDSDRMSACAYCALARHAQVTDFVKSKEFTARRWSFSIGSLLRECGYSESMRNRERMKVILKRLQEDGMVKLGNPKNVMAAGGVRGPFMELLGVSTSSQGQAGTAVAGRDEVVTFVS